MSDPAKPLMTFDNFIKSIQSGAPNAFAAQPASNAKVTPDEHEKMRQHLLDVYADVEVSHSFMDDGGQVFDCVPIEQQPSARAAGIPLAVIPPELPASPTGSGEIEKSKYVSSAVNAQSTDVHGNVRACPPGTIPMRRITPEELARFATLEEFFRKGPAWRGIQPAQVAPEFGAVTHKYAHALQSVNNIGGHSVLSIWSPPVDNSQFSLSQHWYVANGTTGVQTVEAGWQVYPQKYGHSQPVLFVYWTADGYQNTGSYNLDRGEFIQTSSAWTLGGVLTPWSAIGGPIQEIEVAYRLADGRWWLYLNNSAVGYYPATQYNDGPMESFATSIDYGGETMGSESWPPMGSGQFADAGTNRAASHRDIYYYPANGSSPVLADLSPEQPSGCYTINCLSAAPPWNRYFFFGGTGGSNC